MDMLYISYDGAADPLGQAQIIPYIKELSKKNINFTLLTFEKKYYATVNRTNELREFFSRNNIKWVKLNYHKNPAIISTIFDITCGLVRSIICVKRGKVTVVHARSYIGALIAVILKMMFKTKFIFDMRGFWADERVEGKIWRRKGILYRIVKSLERVMIKNADEIIVLAQAAKEIIKSWGYPINNVSVIPCCTDTDYFKPNMAFRSELRQKHNLTDKFIFVHTGSLEYWYMKEAMIDYFKIAKEFIPEAHFLILSHSDKYQISKLIKERNLNPDDFTMLSVAFAQMPQYLAMADVGLIFITPVFSKKASCPTKFAEYLSCALPVIINDNIGDLEDYVLKNNIGAVVRDFSDDEYRQTFKKFLELLDDKELKSRCRKAALDNFSLNIGVGRYLDIYSRLK